jgi:hypothetical protein
MPCETCGQDFDATVAGDDPCAECGVPTIHYTVEPARREAPKWEPNAAKVAAHAAAVKEAHAMDGLGCITCASPYAPLINAAILEGVGGNTIALRFNIPLQSLKRHRKNGHHTLALAAMAAQTTEQKASILSDMAESNVAHLIAKSASLMDRAEAFLDAAESTANMQSWGKALNAVERSIRLAAELVGAFPQKAPSIDARRVTVNQLGSLTTDELKALISLPSIDDGD